MPPTPPEEIERQYQEALRMVQEGMPCTPSTFPVGCEIPLTDKIRPTAERFAPPPKSKSANEEEEKKENGNESEDNNNNNNYEQYNQEHGDLECPSCYSTLGHVDISALQALVREGFNEKYEFLDAPPTQSPLPKRAGTAARKATPSPSVATKKSQSSPATKTTAPPAASPSQQPKPLVVKSKTNFWDPQNAAVHNVSITRPSHDAWGINKIVLIFCDDFVHRIYHLPWWWQSQVGTAGAGADADADATTTNPFQEAVQPILDLLPRNHILIRLLLASLPAGVTIPVHHDTGEWVKHTHRVHVPVLVEDPTQILFRSGVTPDRMQRIDCIPGHVFELNNAAKHAVSNCSNGNHGDDGKDGFSRVHLILDYIVPPEAPSAPELSSTSTTPPAPAVVPYYYAKMPKAIVPLEPGERLIQSRRSIDRYLDIVHHKRPSPTFMILGAQKSGTTSLYEYIMQHPWVVRPTRRETHCLDWRWPPEQKEEAVKPQKGTTTTTTTTTSSSANKSDMTQDEILTQIRNTYFHGTQLQQYPSCMTGDSTPSYLLDSRRVIPRVKAIFGEWCDNQNDNAGDSNNSCMKFFAMLRDPVARAKSHYAMVASTKGTPAQLATRGMEWRDLSLQQVVQMELKILNECGLIPYWDIESGHCNLAVFDTFCDSPQEERAWDKYLEKYVPLNTGSYGLLTRGLYALQLRPWFRAFESEQFLILQLERDLNAAASLSTTMDKVWDHLDLPRFPVKDATPRNTREYEPLEEDMKQYLERFFQPHNRRLVKLLGEEWQNAWEM